VACPLVRIPCRITVLFPLVFHLLLFAMNHAADVAAMTAMSPPIVPRRWHLRRTRIRARRTRIRRMPEGYCAKEQHEGKRERATHGLESGFH
jgi:hypothetical protein